MTPLKRSMLRLFNLNDTCPRLAFDVMRFAWLTVAMLLAPLAKHNLALAQGDVNSALNEAIALDAGDLELRLQAVYRRASSAVVRAKWTDGKTFGACTGVIVTADGHVLLRDFSANVELTFHLPDGRRATGSALGWSNEWGVGLAKLDGPGPWPHVELGGSAGVKSGQCVVTLTCPVTEQPDLVPRPLLGLDWVNRSAHGLWFMTADTRWTNWKGFGVAFDLRGQLIGVETAGYHRDGSVYTEAKLIESLWDDMTAAKNLDQVRLTGRANAAEPNEREVVAEKEIPKETEEKARAATVRIRQELDSKGVSGAIVTEDGVVATCAHHFFMPGAKVIVSVPDGRDVASEVVGISFPCDVGLVRITERGRFPHVELGNSTRLRPGDPCLAIGYGPVDVKTRQPRARTTSVAQSPRGRWSCDLWTNSELSRLIGGDSGGGVFDVDGRLVAVHEGASDINDDGVHVTTHRRVELFHKHWDELHAPFDRTSASGLASTETDIQQATLGVRRSIVEVLDGDKPVALGTIVSADGRILTKASVLPEAPVCRLSDGRVLPSRMLKTVRQHDLAVLKIQAADLPAVDLSETVDPPVGTLVAVVTDNESPALGCISHPALSFPSEHGWLRASLEDSEQGLRVAELHDMPQGPPFATFGPQLLKKGDIILSIDGQATPNKEEYMSLLEIEKKDPIAIAGDPVRLAVLRQDKPMELREVLGPPSGPRFAGQSARCSGFAHVYNVSISSQSVLCGGPVLDLKGRMIGVAIAGRHPSWLLVLPTAIAKTAASD